MNECIIGVGSNINAESNIKKMLDIISKELNVIKISSLVKTKPIGITNQPDFINGAIKVQTGFNKGDLDKYLKKVEDQLGRDRSEKKFGPRTIDLDIVVWNGKVVDEDYYNRDFLQKSVQEVI